MTSTIAGPLISSKCSHGVSFYRWCSYHFIFKRRCCVKVYKYFHRHMRGRQWEGKADRFRWMVKTDSYTFKGGKKGSRQRVERETIWWESICNSWRGLCMDSVCWIYLPAKSKSFAVFVRPWRAAFMRGVKPKLFFASMLIPLHFVRSMLTISVWPVN